MSTFNDFLRLNCQRFAVLLVIAVSGQQYTYAANPQVAIVIDDIGYRDTDRQAIALKGQFTYAIVPFAPLTKPLAHSVNASEREVIAHFPMEALSNNHLLGKGALLTDMDEATTRRQIKLSLDDIPYARGINNHMGSKYTTQSRSLAWLMDELNKRNMYFLDSKTTPFSLAESSAATHGLRTAHRHIFLDNQLDAEYLNKQFKRLLNIAKKNHYAIAIAHPHPQTIKFLATIGQRLKQHNIDLVPLSMVLPMATAKALRKNHNTQYQQQANAGRVAPL